MATKKVHFYKLSLFDLENEEHGHKDIKGLYKRIFKENLDDSSSLVLKANSIENRITMEVLKDDKNFLFCKVGKIKDNNTIQFRDFVSNRSEPVLLPTEMTLKGVEVYTYFLFDYNNGIISMILGQSAPSYSVINRILVEYNNEFYTEIKPVVNPESYKQLYSKNSILSKLEIRLARPSAEVLVDELKLPRSERDKILKSDELFVTLVAKSDYRKGIAVSSSQENEIENLLKPIIDSLTESTEIRINGSPGGRKTQSYKVGNESFTFDNDVKFFEQENENRLYYSIEEVNDEFYNALLESHRTNISKIKKLCNRD